MTRILLCLAMAGSCPAQPLAVGIKGTVRLTADVEGSAVSESKRWGGGPSVEWLLPHGFGIELAALYSPFGYRSEQSFIIGGSSVTRVRADVWEFPVTGKKRLGPAYGLAGWSPRRMAGDFFTTGFSGVPFFGERSVAAETRFHTTHGVVAGAGIELGHGRRRLAPEARYTRWNRDPVDVFGSRGYYIAGPQNEVKFLLGLTWR